jgi:hypothetical protein
MEQNEELDELEVTMILFRYQKAVLNNGLNVPVTHWFGRRGEKCAPREAVTCVCGSDDIGWFAVDLEEFGPAVIH